MPEASLYVLSPAVALVPNLDARFDTSRNNEVVFVRGSASAVPEPNTALLLSRGLVGLPGTGLANAANPS
jgi:hypothetical protein